MKLKHCEYNMDTACVELQFANGSLISIYCPDVEDEITHTPAQRAELDWLIYNEPHTYVNLVLSGEIESYLNGAQEHKLED